MIFKKLGAKLPQHIITFSVHPAHRAPFPIIRSNLQYIGLRGRIFAGTNQPSRAMPPGKLLQLLSVKLFILLVVSHKGRQFLDLNKNLELSKSKC